MLGALLFGFVEFRHFYQQTTDKNIVGVPDHVEALLSSGEEMGSIGYAAAVRALPICFGDQCARSCLTYVTDI